MLLACLFCNASFSQIRSPDFGHQSFNSGSGPAYPWAGGLNSCQFCSIDLDLDGNKDLLIFDRHGNRVLTFLNAGIPGSLDFIFAPSFAAHLPGIHDWVITADYDHDGRMDFFTYGNGSVRVFENVSDTILKFRLVTEMLESYYYTGKVGILVTDVDYPALADIDGDGDLDLLTFFGLGSYVEYHQNLSMEKYGNCDSLDFRLNDHCWGKFRESEGGNKITLNAPCNFDTGLILNMQQSQKNGSRHTGSTLLATDLNGDGLKDLIVGDVDYPGLVALYNGGTSDSARMVSQDTSFPVSDRPVHLFSFPAVSLIDLDNDGLDDLVVSPFDPNLKSSDNYNCIWFYKNTGSGAEPRFEFRTDRLFRNEMIDFGSASHPLLTDFDYDGLQDLLVGNDGYYDSSYYQDAMLHSVYHSQIAYFRNTGTETAPVFTWMTDDLAGISALKLRGAFPAAADLNADGFTDLLIGNADGTFILFPNNGSSGGVPSFDPPVFNFGQINAGDYSAPQLFDLDRDGLPDLITGRQDGTLAWYKNTGTAEVPVFTLQNNYLGGVDVTNPELSSYGFSTPCLFRNQEDETCLLVGSDDGRIHLFTNIDGNLAGKFKETDTLFNWISSEPSDTCFGWQTSPVVAKLTSVAAFDMITGNYSGGLNYLTKRSQGIIIPGIGRDDVVAGDRLLVFPNPANHGEVKVMYFRNAKALYSPPGQKQLLLLQDISGQIHREFPFSGPLVIPTRSLPDGLYFLRYGTAATKLIIGGR